MRCWSGEEGPPPATRAAWAGRGGRARGLCGIEQMAAAARVACARRGAALAGGAAGPAGAGRPRGPWCAAARGERRRGLHGGVDYEEVRQAREIKSAQFYEEQAALRRYFYHVDLQGRLFLEDTVPKNVATSLKSARFLDFFFRMLRANDSGEHAEYPFVSPCQGELNFIRPADRHGPIVFDRIEARDGSRVLVFAGTLEEPWDPSLLAWDTTTDRLYHPVREHARLKGSWGLIRSQVGVALSEGFIAHQNGVGLVFEGREYPIR